MNTVARALLTFHMLTLLRKTYRKLYAVVEINYDMHKWLYLAENFEI